MTSVLLTNVRDVNDSAPDTLPFELLETSADLKPEVEIRRSARRRRTLSAHREGDRSIGPHDGDDV